MQVKNAEIFLYIQWMAKLEDFFSRESEEFSAHFSQFAPVRGLAGEGGLRRFP